MSKYYIKNIKKNYVYYDNYITNNIIIENADNKYNLIQNFTYELQNSKFSNHSVYTDYIEKCSNYVITIYIKDIPIKFFIYSKKLPFNELIKLTKLYKRIFILYKLYNLNKVLNFHLLLCPFKRFMPNSNNHFDSININGGFTYPNGNNIYIYRYDEYSKVVLHEFIHHISIINDSIFMLNNYNINKLKTFFNISNTTNLLPAEGVVEFWACFYNLLFLSVEYCLPFKTLIKKETLFAINQYNKLRKFNKYKLWNEKTNVFSYFIIKLILLYNYEKFLKLELPYNHDTFINFIMNNYKKNFFINLYNRNPDKFTYKSKKSIDFMLFSSF